MTRYEIINYLIERNKFNDFLEIGYQMGVNFDQIKIRNKESVDPNPIKRTEHNLSILTSDEYFDINKKMFDIIFIDGLHTYDQVKKDFNNSLKCLNNNGIIVLHDMCPTTEDRARSFNDGGQWNGDCFKLAIDIYNGEYSNEYLTVNSDQGCMIIFDKKREIVSNNLERDYTTLENNRSDILNLISVDEFLKIK